MKAVKLTLGILGIILSAIILFYALVFGTVGLTMGGTGGTISSSLIIPAVIILATCILMVATASSRGDGGNIVIIILSVAGAIIALLTNRDSATRVQLVFVGIYILNAVVAVASIRSKWDADKEEESE